MLNQSLRVPFEVSNFKQVLPSILSTPSNESYYTSRAQCYHYALYILLVFVRAGQNGEPVDDDLPFPLHLLLVNAEEPWQTHDGWWTFINSRECFLQTERQLCD